MKTFLITLALALTVTGSLQAQRARGHAGSRDFGGNNIFTASPVNFVAMNDYVCYAVGATYERLLGDQKVIGIQLPVYLAIGDNAWANDRHNRMLYTMPGVQFHLVSKHRRFDYSVGPSLLLGHLYERDRYYNYPMGTIETEHRTFTSGMMLDNNFNFQRRNFLFGVHVVFGSTFRNDQHPNDLFFQIGMRFGGRF